ncbi:MAG TPA: hypothetical protein ENO30_05670 [Thermodesulfobium narugense]|nr:hypothetical protein [Thermodesulfobium narugense]
MAIRILCLTSEEFYHLALDLLKKAPRDLDDEDLEKYIEEELQNFLAQNEANGFLIDDEELYPRELSYSITTMRYHFKNVGLL